MPVNTDPINIQNNDPIHINNTRARRGLTIRRPRNNNNNNTNRRRRNTPGLKGQTPKNNVINKNRINKLPINIQKVQPSEKVYYGIVPKQSLHLGISPLHSVARPLKLSDLPSELLGTHLYFKFKIPKRGSNPKFRTPILGDSIIEFLILGFGDYNALTHTLVEFNTGEDGNNFAEMGYIVKYYLKNFKFFSSLADLKEYMQLKNIRIPSNRPMLRNE